MSGKLVKEWTEKDVACTHWISEMPLAVAGFNYGTFKKKTVTDPKLGITIEGYAATEAPGLSEIGGWLRYRHHGAFGADGRNHGGCAERPARVRRLVR